MSDKRSIFQEVDSDQKAALTTGVIDRKMPAGRGGVRIWLFILFALVVLMVLVGGLTRLTDSGLSITEWDLVMGAVPPLNVGDWQQVFASYQQTPEFTLQNSQMTLEEFKSIFWWEWAHRFLGRFMGLVWFAGFVFFLATGRIPAGWTGRLLLLGVLGGLQGAIGWWMVKSGLTGRMVDVASYRLAIHLGLAFGILALIKWYIFALGRSSADLLQSQRNREGALHQLSTILLVVVFVQILLGALVAGIDAGRGYTDWPMMGGAFLPSESFDYQPAWSNFFENPALVQFNHRMFGYVTVILTLFTWWKSRQSAHKATQSRGQMVAALVVLQMGLGIVTVLYAAPVGWAIIHQFGAIVVVVMVQSLRFQTAYPKQQSVRGS
jgi:cytochrome c oxidase assembly protein subunit 15